MAVIADQHDQPTRDPSLVQQRRQHLDFVAGPAGVDLFALQQMIVHRVDHNAHDATVGRSDLLRTSAAKPYPRSLIDWLCGTAPAANRCGSGRPASDARQTRLSRSLDRLAAACRTADLSWRTPSPKGSSPARTVEVPVRLGNGDPIVLRDVRQQFTADSDAHPVDNDHQDEMFLRQRRNHLLPKPVLRGSNRRRGSRPPSSRPAAWRTSGTALANLRHPIEQPGVGFGQLRTGSPLRRLSRAQSMKPPSRR
jgi:hypothetical protein